jgi:hypothetical protein
MGRPTYTALAAFALTGLLFTGSAYATVIYTPLVDISGKNLECSVFNVSTKPVTVTIDWLDYTGTVQSTITQAAAPGAGYISSLAGPTNLLCRFTFNASKSSLRTAYCIGSPCQTSGEAH